MVAVKLDGGDTNKLYWVELTVHVYDLGPCPYTEDGNGTEDPPVVEVTPGRKVYKTRVNGNWLQEDNTVLIQCRGDSLTQVKVVKSQELEYWFYFTVSAAYVGPVSGLYFNPSTGEMDNAGLATLNVSDDLILSPASSGGAADKGIAWVNSGGTTTAAIIRDPLYGQTMSATSTLYFLIDSNNDETANKFIIKKDTAVPNGGTQLMEVTEAGDLTVTGSVSATYLSVGGQIFCAVLHLDTGSGGTTTLANTYDSTYFITTTGATVTLPYAIGYPGQIRTIKVISPATSGTVATQGSETIDGSATYSLSAQNKFVTVQSNGANWYIIGQN